MRSRLRFANWSLRTKMAVLLLVASLLPLLAANWLSLEQIRARQLQHAEELLRARGDEIVGRIDTFVEGHRRSVERMAASTNVIRLLAEPLPESEPLREQRRQLLYAWPKSDPGIRGVAVLDARGVVVLASEPVLEHKNLAYRSFVAQALRGETVVSDVHRSEAETGFAPTIAALAPITAPDGSLRGLAVFWLRAELLWDILKFANGHAGPGSFAVVLDRFGIRIGHSSTPDLVFRPGVDIDAATTEALVAEQRFGPETRRLLADVRRVPENSRLLRPVAPDEPVFRSVAQANQMWNLVASRACQSIDWRVYYMLPEKVVQADVLAAALQQLPLAVLILILALGSGVLCAAFIVRPLGQLRGGARALAAGDFSARVVIDRRDEFGELGQTFNHMAERIQEQSAALLRASEKRYQQLFDSLKEGFCTLRVVFDADGNAVDMRFLEVNPSFEAQSGLKGAPGRLISELRAVEAEWAQTYGQIVKTGQPVHLEAQSRALGRWFDVHAYRIGEPEDCTVGVLFNDITELREARNRRQEQLQRLDLLQQVTRAVGERHDLASIYQVVIRTLEDRLPADFACVCQYTAPDKHLQVLQLGLRSREIATELAMLEQSHIDIDANGLSRCVRGELVYEPDVSTVDFPFPHRLAGAGLRAMVAAPLLVESEVFGVLLVARRAAGSFSSSECEFLRQLSEHVALAAHQARLYNALQVAYDDLRQTQQAAMQQERLRALGQMASGIAHDINNAISPAALYAESLLEREQGLSADGRRQLEIIHRAVHDVAATVARMREFYRQRESSLDSSAVPLNELVRQVIDLTRVHWSDMQQQRGVTVEVVTQLESTLPAILGVESELREALTNLVLNAVDAMPDGGTLTLRTASNGDSVVVEVTDTGVGMDEDARRRCLEPFFTTKGERGTGLGLAMVYGVLRRHGADIEIDSIRGRGTTIRLLFNAAPRGIEARPKSMPVAPKGLRILVIDDDPVLLRSLREALESDGQFVVASHDAQQGIELFRAAQGHEPFSLVITDLGMPYVDGRQVAAAVKVISPTTPVIMLTGWGQRLIADGEIPPHVDLILSKPPKLRDLREALANLCAG